jgi:hypothetical protein
MIDRLSLKYYAEYFHEMDLNISCVSTQTTKNNFLYGPKRLKAPSHDWEKYQVERQPLEVLQNYDWEKALGIGLILGYNDIAAMYPPEQLHHFIYRSSSAAIEVQSFFMIFSAKLVR